MRLLMFFARPLAMKKKKSRRSSPLLWPKAVPQADRHGLDTNRSFLFRHQPLWEAEHFDTQLINLSG